MSSIAMLQPVVTPLVNSVMPQDQNENMAVSLALAGLAFVLTLIIGRPIVTYLRQKKFGKQIRIEGPETHLAKTGTPTMGGVMTTITVVPLPLFLIPGAEISFLRPIGAFAPA